MIDIRPRFSRQQKRVPGQQLTLVPTHFSTPPPTCPIPSLAATERAASISFRILLRIYSSAAAVAANVRRGSAPSISRPQPPPVFFIFRLPTPSTRNHSPKFVLFLSPIFWFILCFVFFFFHHCLTPSHAILHAGTHPLDVLIFIFGVLVRGGRRVSNVFSAAHTVELFMLHKRHVVSNPSGVIKNADDERRPRGRRRGGEKVYLDGVEWTPSLERIIAHRCDCSRVSSSRTDNDSSTRREWEPDCVRR